MGTSLYFVVCFCKQTMVPGTPTVVLFIVRIGSGRRYHQLFLMIHHPLFGGILMRYKPACSRNLICIILWGLIPYC